jgi:two-component system, NtrC family, nitrogen regulation sensor histidine kinase GlnL
MISTATQAEQYQPFSGLDLLSSAVVLLDAQELIRHMNPAAENLFAVAQRTWLGRPLSQLLGSSKILAAALDNALKNNWSYTGHNIEVTQSNPLGDHPALHLDCTVTPVDADRAKLLLEFRPIDHQLRAAREEREAVQQQANRELIRNLAHEIKNPLGGIRGSAQLLERELSVPALREYTQVIISEADRLQDLMQRLLSSHRTMQPALVNIHEILERVLRLIHAEFPGVRVRRDYDTSLPDLTGDREQLIQAILNIARNAAQAMTSNPPIPLSQKGGDDGSPLRGSVVEGAALGRPGGDAQGEIVFRTRSIRNVTLAKKRYSLALELQVIDNGRGIPDAIRDRIFYPLVSGREGGSGLGLTLTQSFIHQHHGTIEVESRPGRTAFRLLLPLLSVKTDRQ